MSNAFKVSINKNILFDIVLLSIAILLIFTLKFYNAIILSAPVILFFSIRFWIKKDLISQLKLCLIVLLTGNTLLGFLHAILILTFCLIQIIQDKRYKIDLLSSLIVLFFICGLFSYLFSQVVEFNPLSLPLNILTFGSLLSYYILIMLSRFQNKDIKEFLVFILIASFIEAIIVYIEYVGKVGLYKVLIRSSTADLVTGTFYSANSFGLLQFISFFIALSFFINNKGFLFLFLSLFYLLFAILSDAKSYLVGFFIAGVLFLFFNLLRGKSPIKTFLILVSTIFLIFWGGIEARKKIEPILPFIDSYITGKYNHKYQYFERAADPSNRNLFQYMLGTGPGTSGSRSANSRTYNTMYKKEGSFTLTILPPFTSTYAHIFLVDLYQYEYATGAHFRSALLGNPFNSLTAIFIEYGLIGFFIITMIHIYAAKKAYSFSFHSSGKYKTISILVFLLVITFYIAGLMDQIYEMPVPMFFLWSMVGIFNKQLYKGYN